MRFCGHQSGPAARTARSAKRGGPRPRRRLIVVPALGALVLAAGCAALGPEAQRFVDNVVGLDARVIRACLGDSYYREERPDSSEIWAYKLPAPGGGAGADIEITRAVGPATGHARPSIENGDPTERRNAGEDAERVASSRIEAGTCLHVFMVANGAVQSYRGRGVDASGLNADSSCIARLEPCLSVKPVKRIYRKIE